MTIFDNYQLAISNSLLGTNGHEYSGVQPLTNIAWLSILMAYTYDCIE